MTAQHITRSSSEDTVTADRNASISMVQDNAR